MWYQYIYLHEWLIFMVNVGKFKYTIPWVCGITFHHWEKWYPNKRANSLVLFHAILLGFLHGTKRHWPRHVLIASRLGRAIENKTRRRNNMSSKSSNSTKSSLITSSISYYLMQLWNDKAYHNRTRTQLHTIELHVGSIAAQVGQWQFKVALPKPNSLPPIG